MLQLPRVRPLGADRGGVGGKGHGERRLAHRGAPGEDQEVRRLQPRQLLVEPGEPGRHARDLARLVVGALDEADRRGEDGGEVAEAAAGFADLGEREQLLLRAFDLLQGRRPGLRVVGLVDEVLAEPDQAALDRKLVDDPAVLDGVDDRLGRVGKAGEVARPVELLERLLLVEEVEERLGVGQHPLADPLGADLEQALVDGLEEVLAAQELRDPVVGLVVDEHGAEQRLLRLQVVRLGAQPRQEGLPALARQTKMRCLFCHAGKLADRAGATEGRSEANRPRIVDKPVDRRGTGGEEPCASP